MKLIKELTNAELGFKSKKVEYRIRKAVRAVVLDNDGKVAILHASKNGYHKIPGGGIEPDENMKVALAREIYEETGCTATVKDEVGIIMEYRDNMKQLQISYCYLAYVKKQGEPHFTKSEKEEGFELEWLSINEALRKFKQDDHSLYVAKFMSTRDQMFLKEARKEFDLK